MLGCGILLKNIPMGYRNALLPGHLLKERFINCLTCSQNTCDILIFFKSLASEERTCYFFHLYLREKEMLSPQHFKVFA